MVESIVRVLLAHGSSDQAYTCSLQQLADRVADHLGELVQTVYLGDVLPQNAQVLPLFLAQGKHRQCDVRIMLEAANARLVEGPAEHPAMMAEMLQAMATEMRQKQRAVLFAVYRLTAAEALVTELYRISKRFPLPSVAALHGYCDVSSVLGLWRDEGLQDVLIQPALLFPGHSLDGLQTLAANHPMHVSVGEPLAMHAPFADWLARCFRGEI